MIEKDRARRRAWPWTALAVLLSAVPSLLMVMTARGGIDYLPLVSLAWRLIGVDARHLLALDLLVVGVLPLLALSAAGFSWLRWQAGMVGAALLGVMAVVNLVVFVGECPWPFTPAEVSAGSQPDYISSGPANPWAPPLLATIACAAAALALSVGSRRVRTRRM
ncbi:hypothetical protein DI270_018260 [Microbispora triticiradicis]|uniref:DUF1772 domain-containing protein n=1 Tax=Microbispora triticiradicis TaxID=2200763 RepID=A0ABX9LI02_9ACTN|nr:hypothetical protein [Microbispora triticiradicis]RGA03594.1 hypothetical protein DI270_018260 [Microbispora triticiradicis]GLW26234.1 hypothetical protein Mame01_62760 [Microbispora amethystogenes]